MSTPLKSLLVKRFRFKRLRIDPLYKTLLICLHTNDYKVMKKSELEIWSLKISSFHRNISSDRQIFLFSIMEIETSNYAESTNHV
jgi:hypothetical protein